MTRTRAESAARFRHFADIEAPHSSPFYARLATIVAQEESLLDLCALASPGQPLPNLLFSSIHYLLLKPDPDAAAHPFRNYFPDLAASSQLDDPKEPFRDFCSRFESTLRPLLETRRVQTNEARRSAVLLPGFATVLREAGNTPLALIEVGASAGLNLLWDHYCFNYKGVGEVTWGDAASPLILSCEARGTESFPLPPFLPPITFRAGVDLNPVDINDPDATLWLRALVWPEHTERAKILETALELARANPPRLLGGDGVALLPSLFREVPMDTTLCVFHSHTVNQFPQEARERFDTTLRVESQNRSIYRLALEGLAGQPFAAMTLFHYAQGECTERVLAHYDPHGAWCAWL